MACRLRGDELRLRLLDQRLLRGDLAADAVDGRLLGRDLVARGVDRQPVVAVVDARRSTSPAWTKLLSATVDRRDIAGDLGGERGGVGAHIGVVGGDHEAAGT